MTVSLTRRGLFGAVMAAAATPALAAGPAPAESATLMVSGPAGGSVDGWADWLSPMLGRVLSPGGGLTRTVVGGEDGVTAANQFEARTVPDGATALLLPGSAAMAWLTGDTRARFDAALWVPAMTGVTPGVVVSRLTAEQARGGKLRVAASTPAGPELPGLLGLDLLDVEWVPVFGLSSQAAATALARQEVDAVCLNGRHVADAVAQLATADAMPLFSFGSVDASGLRQRNVALPAVPTLEELLAGRTAQQGLVTAWRATAAAAELDVALVLPHLTPAAMVALWRRACAQAVGSDALQTQANAAGVRAMPAPAATANIAAILADGPTQIELRRWLAAKVDYRG